MGRKLLPYLSIINVTGADKIGQYFVKKIENTQFVNTGVTCIIVSF